MAKKRISKGKKYKNVMEISPGFAFHRKKMEISEKSTKIH